jgi:hypothetical protein
MRLVVILGGSLLVLATGLILWSYVDQEEPVSAVRWTVSYLDAEEKSIVDSVFPPVADNFVELPLVTAAPKIQSRPVAITMTLPSCRNYDRYRFWVGPHGADSTSRQPLVWNMYIRNVDGTWVTSASENKWATYRNQKWYDFPLYNVNSCISEVKMEVIRVVEGNFLRMYQIQFYRGSLVDKTIDVLK